VKTYLMRIKGYIAKKLVKIGDRYQSQEWAGGFAPPGTIFKVVKKSHNGYACEDDCGGIVRTAGLFWGKTWKKLKPQDRHS